MAELLKSVMTYRVETLDEADTFISQQENDGDGEVTKASKEHKVKKEDDFYLVTIQKSFLE